jgi:putative flippase GtrA
MTEEQLTFKNVLRQFTQREAHPTVQFLKYGIGGVIATGTHILIFFALSLWLLPALLAGTHPDAWLAEQLGVLIPEMEESIRRRNFAINNGIAFLFSNLVAYLINFHWVFHPGRHRRHIEIGLFLLVSTVSLIVGVQFGMLLMRWLETSTTVSQAGNIVASVMINYVCRKFLVFQR